MIRIRWTGPRLVKVQHYKGVDFYAPPSSLHPSSLHPSCLHPSSLHCLLYFLTFCKLLESGVIRLQLAQAQRLQHPKRVFCVILHLFLCSCSFLPQQLRLHYSCFIQFKVKVDSGAAIHHLIKHCGKSALNCAAKTMLLGILARLLHLTHPLAQIFIFFFYVNEQKEATQPCHREVVGGRWREEEEQGKRLPCSGRKRRESGVGRK